MFGEKVWRKVRYDDIKNIKSRLNKREIEFLKRRGISNDTITTCLRKLDDGYYLISTQDGIITYDQPTFFDIEIDGLENLAKYASLLEYVYETLPLANTANRTSEKKFGTNVWSDEFVKNNFDVDEDFIKLFKPN